MDVPLSFSPSGPSPTLPSLSPPPSPSNTTTSTSSPSSTTTSTTTSTSTSTSSSSSSTLTDFSSTSTSSSSTFSSTSSSSPTSTSSDDPQSSSSSTPIPLATSSSITTPSSSSSPVVFTSPSVSPSPTAAHSSDLSFFSDTSAVAGTFTVVGLVSLASVIAVVLYIARRRRSRSYYDDAEFLGKSPELSPDPPLPHIPSHDDSGSSDQSHYGAPLTLASPPVAYYPDHAYVFHPQAFSASGFPPPGSNDYPGHTQGYHSHHIRSPEVHIIDSAPRSHVIMPHPNQFAHVQLDSAPGNQVSLTDALLPSAHTTLSVPNQEENRFSVDSFYSGIETDTPPHSGRAI